MTNKYLEKIAARMSASKALHTGSDIYTIHKSRKKTKKKKTIPAARASRKWNRGATRQD